MNPSSATRAGSADALADSPLMRFVPAEHHARLRAGCIREQYAFGDWIVREGAAADAWYVLVSGRARVVKSGPDGRELALNRLLPGEAFGESALLDGGVRQAGVRASTAVEVLRLPSRYVQALVAEFPALRDALALLARWRALHGFLQSHGDFAHLPEHTLAAVMAEFEPQTVVARSMIVREGDPPGPMYVLREGRARAWTGTRDAAVHRAFYRAGDFFGELSLLDERPRAASVEAVSDCELLALSPDSVARLREREPAFARMLEHRRALYHADQVARVPLDFAEELLPADARDVPLDAAAAVAGDSDIEAGAGRRRPIKRFHFVAQVDEMDCGAACFAMVCRHFGRVVSLSRIRELCHTAHDGTSLRGLVAAAAEVGLAARALKVSRQHLADMPLPAICHYEGNHWLVVYRVDDRFVYLADPARSKLRLTHEEFLAKWTGYAALFDYVAGPAPELPPPAGIGWLWPFVAEHRSNLGLAAGLAMLASLLGLLFPVITQFVVDQVIVGRDLELLAVVVPAMLAALVFLLLANLIQQYLLSFIAVRIDSSVLDFLTRRLLALPMRYFQSRRTGDIQRRLDGARHLRQFVVEQGVDGLLASIQLIGCVLLMVLYSPALAGLYLLAAPLYAALMLYSRRVLRPLYADLEAAHGRYASHQIDAVKGIEAVKAAAAEQGFRDAMLAQFLEVSRKQFRGNFVIMAYQSALQAVGLLTTVLFLWAGAHAVVRGEFTVGAFVAFSSLMAMASSAVLRALGTWDGLQIMAVLLERLNDVIEPEPEQGRDRSRLRPVPSLEGHIELRGIGLRYGGPESAEVLSGISFEIPAGKTWALVGRSGCGKTSLVKLIAGLLPPSSGRILFDRMDSADLNHRDLRRQIGFVLQDNHLFDQSIARNIAFGDPEPDPERVRRAAQMANAHDFIERLPLGYETRVGETGLALSGGQRQRIAIARAIYHDPAILIFDEATSALDTESERAIQKNLGELTRGRTCLVIAHRLSTIRDADRILVMDGGRIAEQGSHDELIERRGLYFYLCSQQLGPAG